MRSLWDVETGTERQMLIAMRRTLNTLGYPRQVLCSETVSLVYEEICKRAGQWPCFTRTGAGILLQGVELVDDPDITWIQPFPDTPPPAVVVTPVEVWP